MSFDEALQSLLDRCPDSRGAAVMDPDGIPVVMQPSGRELETLGAELANILREITHSQRELHYGAVRQISIEADEMDVYLTTIRDGYFLVLVSEGGGPAGRARFLSRLTSERLYPEFVL